MKTARHWLGFVCVRLRLRCLQKDKQKEAAAKSGNQNKKSEIKVIEAVIVQSKRNGNEKEKRNEQQ